MINSHKIKSRMFELALNQETVAKDMDMDYSTLNLKLNNKRRIYIDEVAKLCEILQLKTPSQLKECFGLDFLIVPNSCENDTNKTLGGA